jgi:hypothetical protein
METVTLYAEDFKKVHNTLCELRSLVERMTHSMIKIEDVERIIEGFEQGLKSAYEQDHTAFDRKHDYYSEAGSEMKLRSVWSIYEVEDLYADHPYKGATELYYGDHWGEESVVEEIKGSRWIDLWAAADAAIRASGDEHHIFIERFATVADEPQTLRLTTGS